MLYFRSQVGFCIHFLPQPALMYQNQWFVAVPPAFLGIPSHVLTQETVGKNSHQSSLR